MKEKLWRFNFVLVLLWVIMRVFRKVTPGEMLIKQATKKNCIIYKKYVHT
jgi:hypothetical protein